MNVFGHNPYAPNYNHYEPEVCCCEEIAEKVCTAVCDFFTCVCEAIGNALAWTCDRLGELCEYICDSCDEAQPHYWDNEWEDDYNDLDPPIVHPQPPLPIHYERPEEDDRMKPDRPQRIDPYNGDIFDKLLATYGNHQAGQPLKFYTDIPDVPPKLLYQHIEIADMGQRKVAALERLNEIANEQLEFECVPDVLNYNLDELLSPYKGERPFNDMLLLFDLAYPLPRSDKITQKRYALNNILIKHNGGEYRYHQGMLYRVETAKLVELRVKQLYDILSLKWNELQVKKDPALIKELQVLIGSTITRVIQAHTDGCIVQTSSQMDNICADVLVNVKGIGTEDKKPQIRSMAGNSLYKHRRALIATLVKRADYDYNGNAEIYDEEAVRALVEGRIPPNGNFNTYANQLKRDKFNTIYTKAPTDGSLDQRPFPFLLRGASQADSCEDVGTLKVDLVRWGLAQYELDGEDETTQKIVKLASKKTDKGEDGDAFGMCTTDLSEVGVKWLLEAASVIREKNPE